jgi:hypothetical protein
MDPMAIRGWAAGMEEPSIPSGFYGSITGSPVPAGLSGFFLFLF